MSEQPANPRNGSGRERIALVLTGGGARAAYQIGFLRCLALNMPAKRFDIITGVSAGAINAAFLASHSGPLATAVDELSDIWTGLSPERIFHVGGLSLAGSVTRWGLRLLSGGSLTTTRTRGFLDTAPLRRLLEDCLRPVDGEILGIADNVERGRLAAIALSTLNYATGQTVTWVQGEEIAGWERASRIGINTRLTVDHVMASASLPLMFPAVKLAGSWFGDGGVRMLTPLAPAIHLGADRILAISTRYARSREEADRPAINTYPPPAQIAGTLLNAIFLDSVDQDSQRLSRINRLLRKLPPEEWGELRPVKLLVLRPSIDLGILAAQYEASLPSAFRFMTRGLGTQETASPDLLSLLMFQADYLKRLIEIGEQDAHRQVAEIGELMNDGGAVGQATVTSSLRNTS
jgi:NTE family protein